MFLDDVDIYNNIKPQNICSSIKTGSYIEFLQAWKKYIPHQTQMKSNCWYSNTRLVPKELMLKVRNVYSYRNISSQFPKEQLHRILNTVLDVNNSSHVFSKINFCLPLVYLIGVPKCGTSLLYTYISSHPLFAKPQWKEGQFWRDFLTVKNEKYQELEVLIYLYHFFEASRRITKNLKMFTIDASASTVYATLPYSGDTEKATCTVPYLLHHLLPTTKIMVILRNPIQRLWSDYWYFCSYFNWRVNGVYKVPRHIPNVASQLFHNLTVAAINRFQTCISEGKNVMYCSVLENSSPAQDTACTTVRLGLSMYYFHLIKWFNIFPRKQIQVVRLEDLSKFPHSTMKIVWDFLEIPGVFVNSKVTENKNPWISNSFYRSSFVLLPETEFLLKQFFMPYNAKLSLLLDDNKYLWNDNH